MTLFAEADSGGALGASGFTSAASRIPARAASPKPLPVRARSWRLVNIKKLVGIHQSSNQFGHGLLRQEFLRRLLFFGGGFPAIDGVPRFFGRLHFGRQRLRAVHSESA